MVSALGILILVWGIYFDHEKTGDCSSGALGDEVYGFGSKLRAVQHRQCTSIKGLVVAVK